MKVFEKVLLTIMIILTVIVLLIIIFLVLPPIKHEVVISPEIISINSDGFYSSNNQQPAATVWMGTYQNELYFFPHSLPSVMTRYQDWLCVFRDGQIQKIRYLPHTSIVGCSGESLYLMDTRAIPPKHLACYDLSRNEEIPLYTGRIDNPVHIMPMEDGTLTVPLNLETDKQHSMLVFKEKHQATSTNPLMYQVKDKRYFVQYKGNAENVMVTDQDGNTEQLVLSNAKYRFLIPANGGLLIHNYHGDTQLYYVNPSGALVTLFAAPCLSSKTAVAVTGDSAYLSIKRYEDISETGLGIGMTRFQNDTVEGTYRISLNDYTAEKISNNIYDGLYYFGGDYLYACDDNCTIYQFDLQGNDLNAIFKLAKIKKSDK